MIKSVRFINMKTHNTLNQQYKTRAERQQEYQSPLQKPLLMLAHKPLSSLSDQAAHL